MRADSELSGLHGVERTLAPNLWVPWVGVGEAPQAGTWAIYPLLLDQSAPWEFSAVLLGKERCRGSEALPRLGGVELLRSTVGLREPRAEMGGSLGFCNCSS